MRKLLRWAEGCACHPFSSDMQATQHVREAKLRAEISCPKEVACTCPMMGCQAPFLVAGKLDSVRDNLLSTGFNDIILHCKCPLTAQQWSDLECE